MKISQLMTRGVRTCLQTDTLDVAVRQMWDSDIGSVVIVDDFGQVVGIVTDRDACMASYFQCQPMQSVQCKIAMSNHVVTCHADDDDSTVATLMSKHKIRRIPVVDDTMKPIGMVSLNDLAIATQKRAGVPAQEVASTLASICEHRPLSPVATA